MARGAGAITKSRFDHRIAASANRLATQQFASQIVPVTERRRCCMPVQDGRPLMWALLLLPFIGLLWVPFYNFMEPELFGFPFFYWYQLAWVPITSVLIWLVYRARTPDEDPLTPPGNS
jgi:hypothetical protein